MRKILVAVLLLFSTPAFSKGGLQPKFTPLSDLDAKTRETALFPLDGTILPMTECVANASSLRSDKTILTERMKPFDLVCMIDKGDAHCFFMTGEELGSVPIDDVHIAGDTMMFRGDNGSFTLSVSLKTKKVASVSVFALEEVTMTKQCRGTVRPINDADAKRFKRMIDKATK